MKLLWAHVLQLDDIWEPEFQGTFYENNSFLYFLFRKDRQMMRAQISNNGINRIQVCLSSVGINTLPGQWCIVGRDKENVMCSLDHCIDLTAFNSQDHIPDEFVQEYINTIVNRGVHLLKDDFVFDDYVISHFGQCGYICKKNDTFCWKMNGQACLYTDMVRYGDNVVFGTDGNGGHLYILNLATGNVVCDLNTNGTNHYAVLEEVLYVLVGGKRSKIVAVSASTGEIVDEFVLQGRVHSASRIYLVNDRIYATTFVYKNGVPKKTLMNCVQICPSVI